MIFEKKSEFVLKKINEDLRKNHFYNVHVQARIDILKTFLTQPIPRDYRNITPEYRGKIIFINHLIVNLSIWGGLFFFVGIWLGKENYLFKFLSLSILSITFFFTLLHRSYEYRELYTLTGFLFMGAVMLLQLLNIKPFIVKSVIILIIILIIIGSYHQTIPEL